MTSSSSWLPSRQLIGVFIKRFGNQIDECLLSEALVISPLWIFLQDTHEGVPNVDEFLSRQLVVSKRSIRILILLDVNNRLLRWAIVVFLLFAHDRNFLLLLYDSESDIIDINKLLILNNLDQLVFNRNELFNITDTEFLARDINCLFTNLVVVKFSRDALIYHIQVFVLDRNLRVDVFDTKFMVNNIHMSLVDSMIIFIDRLIFYDDSWTNMETFDRLINSYFLDMNQLIHNLDWNSIVDDLNKIVDHFYCFITAANLDFLVLNRNIPMDLFRTDVFVDNIDMHFFATLGEFLVADIDVLVFTANLVD